MDGMGIISSTVGRCDNFCSDNLKGRDKLGDLGLDGRMKLKWTWKK